ncbi:MAG: universal stress protein [Thermodesulfovibrionales bacterium]|nr:universal stress protein [Thermodesulfovibrionales bacterium]
MQKILLCIDNEPQSIRAEDYAISFAKIQPCEITAIHVVDPFLKKFTNEIYAVNRDECRMYLDRELTAEGNEAIRRFFDKATASNLQPFPKIILRNGDPEETILTELLTNKYDLLVMGAKLLKNWKERFESYKLSERLFQKSPISMIFIR